MEHDRDLILAEVKERFSRRERGSGRFSRAELRALALRALAAGHSAGTVAAAAGVSRQSVLNWKRCVARIAAPVELQVVEGPPLGAGDVPARDDTARLRFASGAVLEFPFSQIDSRFLALLNGGAS